MTEIEMEVVSDNEPIELEIAEVIETGGSSGTSNYNQLTNKPSINNVVLQGNKSLDDLGITSAIGTEVESYVENHKSELKGDQGEAGADGSDGFSPVVAITQEANGYQIKITDASGDHTAHVTNGTNGQNGSDGEDGYSPQAVIEQTSTGAVIYITDQDGTTTATITNGTNGSDYVITQADYNAIAEVVLGMLTSAESVSV